MKSYREIITHFSSLSMEDKEDYLYHVNINELKLLRDNLLKKRPNGNWTSYIAYIYDIRLTESRNWKLTELGIR